MSVRDGAAACAAAGAGGAVLDSQFALVDEASPSGELRAMLRAMDGTETVCLGESIGYI